MINRLVLVLNIWKIYSNTQIVKFFPTYFSKKILKPILFYQILLNHEWAFFYNETNGNLLFSIIGNDTKNAALKKIKKWLLQLKDALL